MGVCVCFYLREDRTVWRTWRRLYRVVKSETWTWGARLLFSLFERRHLFASMLSKFSLGCFDTAAQGREVKVVAVSESAGRAGARCIWCDRTEPVVLAYRMSKRQPDCKYFCKENTRAWG